MTEPRYTYLIELYQDGRRKAETYEGYATAFTQYNNLFSLIPLTAKASIRLFQIDLNGIEPTRLLQSDTT